MRVCTHNGLVIAVFTRNEHCPPHVHVGPAEWDARFEFSFWHQGVRFWDVTPERDGPNAWRLEELRQVIKLPSNLRRARELWWATRQTLCLENQYWDIQAQEVVKPGVRRAGALAIETSRFDGASYLTTLHLRGRSAPVEISL